MPSRQRSRKLKDRNRKAAACSSQLCETEEAVGSNGSEVQTNSSSLCSLLHRDVGLHEESFHNLDPDDVLHGLITIETMDYVTQILKAQFVTLHGLYAPSYLYALTLNNDQLPSKVPKEEMCVQIHYCNAHFVVSAQHNGQISLYDSVSNVNRIQDLFQQLQLLYDCDRPCDIEYRVPQSQESTNLCALFATANALTLLCRETPGNSQYDKSKMRQHLRDCLREGQIIPFPLEEGHCSQHLRDCLREGQIIPFPLEEGHCSVQERSVGSSRSMMQKYFRNQKYLQKLKNMETKDHTQLRRTQIKEAVTRMRLNSSYKQKEYEQQRTSKREKRQDKEFRQKESARETTGRKRKRLEKEYQEKESTRETLGRKRKRLEKEYQEKESTRETLGRKRKRLEKEYQEKESTRETLGRKRKRLEKEYQEKESTRETLGRKRKRLEKEYQEKESTRETLGRKRKRLEKEYQEKESTRETLGRKRKRLEKEYQEKESTRETLGRKRKRLEKEYQEKESTRETLGRKRKRLEKEYQEKESTRETLGRKRKRLEKEYQEKESTRETLGRKRKRLEKEYQEKESTRETLGRKRKRLEKEYRQHEKEKDKFARQQQRKKAENVEKESARQTPSRKRKRLEHEYKEKESARETPSRKRKRLEKEYRQHEKEKDKFARQQQRKKAENVEKESARETPSRKRKRLEKEYRQHEKEKDKFARQQQRKKAENVEKESARETPSRKRKRLEHEYKEKESARETPSRKRKRLELEYQEKECARETPSRKGKRLDPEYSQKESQRETSKRKHRRESDPFLREMERERETQTKRCKRNLDANFRKSEQTRDKSAKSRARQNEKKRHKERIKEAANKAKRRQKSSPQSIEDLVQLFHREVCEGPTFICSCCEQLLYRHSVVQATTCRSNMGSRCLRGILSEAGKEWLCKTCHRYLKSEKMPPCALINGLELPFIPDVLKELHSLEFRLLSPRIPFMKIFQAPRGQQLKIQGNVVNVPCNVVQTVSTLPRLQSNDGTIKVNFKRRLSFKSNYINQNIRPNKVKEAAEWLTKHGNLYIRENISFDNDWTFSEDKDVNDAPTAASDGKDGDDHDKSTEQNSQTTYNTTTEAQHKMTHDCQRSTETTSANDDWNEIEETELHGGSIDTMLSDPHFVEAEEKDFIWSVAPGQHSYPLSIFKDSFSEELAFPSIFCGQQRCEKERETKIHYSEIVKSELRRSDRRVAKCVDNIFFKTKKLQMQHIFGKMQVAMRKFKHKEQKVTAGDLKQEGAISRLIHLDEGYRVLRTVRGSPPYFEKAKKDLFAMIRFLGPATFFMSFSAAETRWSHLLKILSKTVDNKDMTDDEVRGLTWQEKCRLIQSDPVTTSRHFHFSVQALLRFMHSNLHPLGGRVQDYFYRVEYQHRGSPHIHMLVWIEGSPQYDEHNKESEEAVKHFIDRVISCSANHDHADLQLHRHSRTCNKGNRACRFHYPQPPMKATVILTPLEDLPDTDTHKKNYKTIKDLLNSMKYGEDITVDQFLEKLGMSEDQYMMAVRSSISSTTVFLKRSPKEIRINPYIPSCLSSWRANMDAQFILDIYACAMYVVGYISKSQRGMSLLLDKACKEAREKGSTIREQVSLIGNKFTNNVEISAQEAVDICLQVPLRQSSRQVVFIHTSPPEERTCFLKPIEDLAKLEDDSDDVAMGNMISRYCNRPESLEELTLADWASSYDMPTSSKKQSSTDAPEETVHNEDQPDEATEDPAVMNATGEDLSSDHQMHQKTLHAPPKRKVPRVLRYVRYNQDTHPEEFSRERIMLFTSWRDEDLLIGTCNSFQDRYKQVEVLIIPQLKIYQPHAAQVDLAEVQAVEEMNEQWENLAPSTEHENQRDRETEIIPSDDHSFLAPPADLPEYDMGPDLGAGKTAQKSEMMPFHEMSDEDYRNLIQSLNDKQREFFNDILHKIKMSEKPYYGFLSGGAGVGKSRLLTAIYQTAMKYYNSFPGSDYNTRHVLILAPTGKAAFNVCGNTIQSALKVLPNQQFNMNTPTSDVLNTLRCELGETKLIIVDEISMVGLRLFTLIHKRMQDIKGSSADFGGVSVLCFGDLFQFKPVYDCFLFSNDVHGTNALATNLWQKHFNMYELTEIMRQKDCCEFAELLNRLREGQQTSEDIQVLESRLCTMHDPNYPTYAPHLFMENTRVAAWNDDAYTRSTKIKRTCIAHDVVVGDVRPEVAAIIKRQIPDNPAKTMQLHSQLKLGIDLNFEVCININTSDGLTNGASGIIKHMNLTPSGKATRGVIWVKFQEEAVGRQARMDNSNLYKHRIDKSWTPILPVSRQFKVGRNGHVLRTQFPLRPSAAKTLHRAQGETLSSVVVDFAVCSPKIRKPFFQHAHYVGLSRVTSLHGLYIQNLNKQMISVNEDVKEEMKRLRTSGIYTLSPTPIYSLSHGFLITYNNARSFHRHYLDCLKQPTFRVCDVCFFSETRIHPTEPDAHYSIPGLLLHRNDDTAESGETRPPHGLAAYTKKPATVLSHSDGGIEVMTLTSEDLPGVAFLGVYKAPTVSSTALTRVLLHCIRTACSQYAVIIGDVNHDLNKLGPLPLPAEYHQLVKGPTTDSRTCIDHIYTNLPLSRLRTGTSEAYWSDHKIIWLSVK